ncbi:hypothetical protein ACS5PN_28030 [Roseateles sp. NT4]|uniref:hypothetical protein n=1 Tax=Roseateles sp. NT4 TaxID=3453715 RepID=UPI003EE8A7FC
MQARRRARDRGRRPIRNGSDIESDNFNPASAYGYRNGSDVESDAFRPAMAYGYRNASDVESDNLMAARELANNRTMLNAAERAARPEAYMSIEQLPRVTVSGVSQATKPATSRNPDCPTE